ncbi:MAG TPA: M14 family metallopeptidase [Vicinamibacterales bacterium]|nr:M14 family metallopeptidase [Vicinamibacterales bacterium]
MTRRFIGGGLLAAAVVAHTPAAFAQPSPFRVGTVAAASGQTAFGAIEVPAGSDPALSIPVAVVRGARPGPVLALVAGAHGTEYASIVAVRDLIGTLNAAEISGTVILVPLVNVPSFEQTVPHLNPVDQKNMNRFYPGRPDGTQTDRASHAITREIVERADHLIDLHGGDIDESLRPYTYWTKTGREKQDAVSRGMALAFGLDHIIISTDRPTDPAASRYLENTATTRGKPSITVEAGHAGTVEPRDVEALVSGSLSVMRYLKMLPGEPTAVESPVWIERLASIVSSATGMFTPSVVRGSYVQKGMKVGSVLDYLGRPLADLRAPESGVLLYIRAVPSLVKGETVGSVGVVQR